MPYDIYGNSLQRGHCEVHPDVPEDYPCSVCMAQWRFQQKEPEPPEPEPEPTLMDYIGFDANRFKAAAEKVVESKEDETAFVEAMKNLFRNIGLDSGFIRHILSEIEKESKNANSVDNP